jgi:hypothetical protein
LTRTPLVVPARALVMLMKDTTSGRLSGYG